MRTLWSRMATGLVLSSILLVCVLRAAAAGPVEPGRTLRVDAGSARVGFDLGATMHTVHGTAGEVTGTVSIVSGSDAGLVLDGKITIPVRALATGNERRDAKMRGESLDAGKHPEITFVPKALGKDLRLLSGELTIRGVSKSVEIPVTVEAAGSRVKVDGKLDVRWADHGVPDPSAFVLRVEKVARTFFHVELVP
jgi:polyisoprenoid-binding protein YceI